MNSFWSFFIHRRRFTLLLIVGSLVAGTIAVIATPKESAPEVEVPVGIVTTILPGGSAQDIERLVTSRIEQEVANVENINKLTSSSSEGVSSITAEFSASANLDKAIADLKEAVDRAKGELPTDANDPFVSRVNFADQPFMLVSIASDRTPRDVTTLGKRVKDILATVPQVSRVTVSGIRDREITVIVRSEALTQYGISLSEVVSGIRGAQASLPIGNLTVGKEEYTLNFEGSLETADEISLIPITSKNGTIIYLGDIATVADGLVKTTGLSRVSVEGEPSQNALTLSLYKKSGGDVTAVSHAVLLKLKEITPTELDGIAPLITYDAGEQVQTDLSELVRTGLETVALVMILLFLTIGWKEAVVAGLSIPLSFVIAFVGIYASGNTINFVSLFSLILAIGILVDSGIVIAEAIHTRTKTLGSAEAAALQTLKEYAWPLTAGTMTTIAVFVPLFFLSGVTGQFISSIPFTIIFVLFASIIVALGFVPLIALWFTKLGNNEEGRLARAQERLTKKLQTVYGKYLNILFENRKWHTKIFIGLFIAFIGVFFLPGTGLLKVIFFPGGDSELIIVEFETARGTPLIETDIAIRTAEETLYREPSIASFVTSVGGGSSFGTGGSGGNLANITINLKPKEERTKSGEDVQQLLRREFNTIPNITYSITSDSGGPPTGAPIVVKLFGDSLSSLERASALIEKELARMEGTKDISSTAKDNGTSIVLTVDRERVASLGLSPFIVADALRTAITGSIASTIETGADDIDIRVRLNLNPNFKDPGEANIATLDEVRQIPIATRSGSVLLGSLVKESIEQGRSTIYREDRERVVSVSSDVNEGANAIALTQALKKNLESLSLPDDVRVSFGGENEDVNKSFTEMGLALIAGLILMLGVLVLEFNSFRYSGYILVIVPLTLIGVFVGLTVLLQPLSFPSMLGVIALAGVVVNHAIILMDSMLYMRKHHPSMPIKELVIEASLVRFRPIVLTTAATAIGMIPLMGVSALWAPLAAAVMFGMIFSLFLTLVTIPLLCYRFPGKALLPKE